MRLVYHSHSGALCSRVDGAATLVVQSATGLADGGLVGAVAARLLLGLLGLLLTLRLGDGLGVLLVFVHGPVEHVVVLEALTDEQIAEDLAQVGVVGLVIEAEATGVVEVDGKLVREATAQDFGWGCHLLLHDTIVLLLLGCRLKALPREATTTEIQHHVAERLHIVTARLLCTLISIRAVETNCRREYIPTPKCVLMEA